MEHVCKACTGTMLLPGKRQCYWCGTQQQESMLTSNSEVQTPSQTMRSLHLSDAARQQQSLSSPRVLQSSGDAVNSVGTAAAAASAMVEEADEHDGQ